MTFAGGLDESSPYILAMTYEVTPSGFART